jgi:hypothetical protein
VYNQKYGVKEDEKVRACSTHGEKRNAYKIMVGKERYHYDDLDVCGRIILRWILER